MTKDFGDLSAVASISLNVGQDTYGSVHVLHVRDMAQLARRQLCVESRSS